MPFLTRLRWELVREQDYKCIWRLTSPLIYEGNGLHLEAPTGFYTDGASIPRSQLIPYIYCEFGGLFNEEAVIHDLTYRIDCVPNMPQRVADDHLLFMLEECGRYADNFGFCHEVHMAVRLGGGASYHKHRVMDVI